MTNYVAGWNMPGYLPESEPWTTDSYDDAVEYMLYEMERYADDLDGAAWDRYLETVSDVEKQRSIGVSVFASLGNCIYWVTTSEEG